MVEVKDKNLKQIIKYKRMARSLNIGDAAESIAQDHFHEPHYKGLGTAMVNLSIRPPRFHPQISHSQFKLKTSLEERIFVRD